MNQSVRLKHEENSTRFLTGKYLKILEKLEMIPALYRKDEPVDLRNERWVQGSTTGFLCNYRSCVLRPASGPAFESSNSKNTVHLIGRPWRLLILQASCKVLPEIRIKLDRTALCLNRETVGSAQNSLPYDHLMRSKPPYIQLNY